MPEFTKALNYLFLKLLDFHHVNQSAGLTSTFGPQYAPCEVMVGRVRSTPAYAVDNFGVKGGCFIFLSNQTTYAHLNFVLI